MGIIAVHDDDFLWSGSENLSIAFLEIIRGEVVIGKESETSFRYLGLQLDQKNDCVVFDQTDYARNLEFIKENEPVDEKRLRGKAGQLMWLATQTRPDLLIRASIVASLATESRTISDMRSNVKDVNKSVKWAKRAELHPDISSS